MTGDGDGAMIPLELATKMTRWCVEQARDEAYEDGLRAGRRQGHNLYARDLVDGEVMPSTN